MELTPIGNANFINQNAPVASTTHANHQARFDLQNAMAAQIASDENIQVTELRPTEETYKIDPENEHEKQKNDEEQSEQNHHKMASSNDDEQDEQISQVESHSHIDIKI